MLAILALPSTLASLDNDIIPEKDNEILRGVGALATKVKKNFQAHYHSLLRTSSAADFIQASGGTEADCEEFAKDTMTTITDAVSVANDNLKNNHDLGTKCAEEGNEEASAAQDRVTATTAAAASARTEKEAACGANVELPLNSLDPGSDYKNNDNFILAKDKCANTKEVLIQTEQAAKDATEESATQAAAADVSKSECNCRVQLSQATMWTQAQAAASQHQDTWQRALDVLCVLNTDCEKSTCPTVSRPELPSTVSGEDCPTEADPDLAEKTKNLSKILHAHTSNSQKSEKPEKKDAKPCASCTHIKYTGGGALQNEHILLKDEGTLGSFLIFKKNGISCTESQEKGVYGERRGNPMCKGTLRGPEECSKLNAKGTFVTCV